MLYCSMIENLEFILSFIGILVAVFVAYKKYVNTQNIKSHSLYKSYLFLNEFSLNDSPLSEADCKKISNFIKAIKSFSNSEYYYKEISKLLPIGGYFLLRYGHEHTHSNQEHYDMRQKIINNRGQVKQLIIELMKTII